MFTRLTFGLAYLGLHQLAQPLSRFNSVVFPIFSRSSGNVSCAGSWWTSPSSWWPCLSRSTETASRGSSSGQDSTRCQTYKQFLQPRGLFTNFLWYFALDVTTNCICAINCLARDGLHLHTIQNLRIEEKKSWQSRDLSPGQLVGGSKNASSVLGSPLLYCKLKYSDSSQLLELSGLRCRDWNLLVSKVALWPSGPGFNSCCHQFFFNKNLAC